MKQILAEAGVGRWTMNCWTLSRVALALICSPLEFMNVSDNARIQDVEEEIMKNEEFYNNLSENVKKNLAGCRTQDEIRKVLTEAGVEPLDDELLDAVAGGLRGPIEEQGGCRSFRKP